MADDPAFPFAEDPARPVIVCSHVVAGAPIHYVFRDGEGDWQFLCGADGHGEDDAALGHLGELHAGDPSLGQLAELRRNHGATRQGDGAAWEIENEGEDFIHDCIAEHGWAVEMQEADEGEGLPNLAYTVGLMQSFDHPELLILGLPLETAEAILNLCGDRIADGEAMPQGSSIDRVIADHPVQMHEVRDDHSLQRYAPAACNHYQGDSLALLQILWPDEAGHLPDHPDFPADLRALQPVLL